MTRRKTTGTFDYNGDELRQHDLVVVPIERGELRIGRVIDDLDQTPRSFIIVQSLKDETTTVIVKPSMVIKVPHD